MSSTSNTATPSTMTGTVAIGNALVGAPITVIDATGISVSATSGANGSYSVSIIGLTAPFLITATDPSGVSAAQYSIAASIPTGTTAPVIANVTPLTTAVTAILTSSGNPSDLAKSGSLAGVSASAVTAAEGKLNALITPILNANNVSATTFDPIGTVFTTNQTGEDAVIDSVSVSSSTTGSGLQISSLADANTAIQLNSSTATSTTLQAPAQPANYLATLVGNLSQCMSGGSCAAGIDSNYLSLGYTTMQTRHPELFAKSSTLTGVKTVAFLPAGTIPGISNPAALVYFLFTGSTGVANFATEIVQETSAGNWDIIGNQEQYDVYIASFLGRLQFTDAADANNGRLESGLRIQIPFQVTVGSTLTPVGSALITGPGLPTVGLYMLGATSGDNPYLTIPATPLTAPFVGCNACVPTTTPDNTMTTEFKWTWTTLTGGASSYAPSGVAAYAASQVDLTTVSQFSAYTVTLYDFNGNQIGTPQTVLNIAPTANAASGTTVAWQTLGSDVIANLLTVNGSSTSVNDNATTGLDWTVPSSTAVYPNFWSAINSQTSEVFSGSVETTAAMSIDTNDYSAPTVSGTSYSETFPRGFVDTLTSSPNTETFVEVQLNWQQGGPYYINTLRNHN